MAGGLETAAGKCSVSTADRSDAEVELVFSIFRKDILSLVDFPAPGFQEILKGFLTNGETFVALVQLPWRDGN